MWVEVCASCISSINTEKTTDTILCGTLTQLLQNHKLQCCYTTPHTSLNSVQGCVFLCALTYWESKFTTSNRRKVGFLFIKKDTDVESLNRPAFFWETPRCWWGCEHVTKEAGGGEDELHNVISLKSRRHNTALQSSLGTTGLLELANENLAWSPWPAPSTWTHYTQSEQLLYTHTRTGTHMANWTLQASDSHCQDLQWLILKCEHVLKRHYGVK